MKICKFFSFVVLFIMLGCSSSILTNVKVDCKIECDNIEVENELNGKMAYLYASPPLNSLLDSCKIESTKFYFDTDKIKNTMPSYIYIPMSNKCFNIGIPSYITLFLTKGDDVQIKIKTNTEEKVFVSGSESNDEMNKYKKLFCSLKKEVKFDKLTNSIQSKYSSGDIEDVKHYIHIRDSISNIIIKSFFDSSEEISNSDAAVYLIFKYFQIFNMELQEKILDNFSKRIQSENIYYKLMSKKLEGKKRLSIGSQAPNFNVFDTKNKSYSLNNFKGKYLYLEFSASWCCWCKKEIPYIREAYHKLKDKGIVFVTIMMDTNRDL
ncbi:MAG: redoxin domain-containing protein [Bacilli bacterium]